jgi:hypothetical protein
VATRALSTLIFVVLLTAACGARPIPSTTAGLPSPEPSAALESTTPVPGVRTAGDLAIQDLAGRLNLNASDIQVVADATVEMPLQGLGCVQVAAGTSEAAVPAQVMGHEVTLAAAGQEYVYHVYARQVVLCSGMGGVTMSPINRPGNSDQAITSAIADLAGRLNASSSDIQVVSAESRDWPDAGLGCPEPGKMYAQVITRGFRIVLQANGQTFEYHSSLSEARLCQ